MIDAKLAIGHTVKRVFSLKMAPLSPKTRNWRIDLLIFIKNTFYVVKYDYELKLMQICMVCVYRLQMKEMEETGVCAILWALKY